MDQWTETLRCPICRKTGKASLTQGEHDEKPTVNSVPPGFKVVSKQHGLSFHCEDCDAEVLP
jgi:hypothetical protein